MSGSRIGIDVGGTFTDLVRLDGGELSTAKVPSTPRDQSDGVMKVLEADDVDERAVVSLAHGTTVATNALLERKGARTALITTAGFRDIIEIGRQNRPALYDLTEGPPPPLVGRDLRFGVVERMGPDGLVQPLDEDGLTEIVATLGSARVQAIAVCLLFSFRHPDHERRIGEVLRAALPGVHVSLSSAVLPEVREYERLATTVADAYLAPRLVAYLRVLQERVRDAGLPAPVVMQSSGGVMDIDAAAQHAVWCLLSGPAGGVVGAAYIANRSGFADVLTLDMGGTSTDVAPVVAGEIQTSTDSVVAGIPIKTPMVDVHTVSAGGGSIAWADAGGALRVGPHSAGAHPGPAAYDNGGDAATVTDANLYLGYLKDGARLGGEMMLSRRAAERALERLGSSLHMSAEETAAGIVEVANVEMVRALRVISVERGLDPRDFALVAFGGAGPMHACALAEELGIDTVLVPKASGVLSALGLAISDVRRDYSRPWLGALDEADAAELDSSFAEMEERAAHALDGPRFERRVDLRYRGQSFELTVDADELEGLAARWHESHELRYGYRMEEEPVEIVNLRLIATVPGRKPTLEEAARDAEPIAGKRRARFDGRWVEVDVLDRTRMGATAKVDGPVIVEFPEATCVVRPGWSGGIDGSGTLVLGAP
jgi:N-methylhydantoinase A